LTFTPPLILTRAQIDFALDVIEESLGEAANAHGLT
jgi:4-aminobutyrate aminotransferase-like enzyme